MPKDKLHVVEVGDPTDSTLCRMTEFIADAKLSFIRYDSMDLCDFNHTYDYIRAYLFATEEDALIFMLKFGGTLDKTGKWLT